MFLAAAPSQGLRTKKAPIPKDAEPLTTGVRKLTGEGAHPISTVPDLDSSRRGSRFVFLVMQFSLRSTAFFSVNRCKEQAQGLFFGQAVIDNAETTLNRLREKCKAFFLESVKKFLPKWR